MKLRLVVLSVLLAAVLVAQTTRPVNLSWSASSSSSLSGFVGYNLYRSTSATGTYTLLTATPVTGLTYVDSTAVVLSTYYYEVQAVAAACTPTTPVSAVCGNGLMSSPSAAVPIPNQAAAPGTPTATVP
jgi:hypothetical protein